MTLFLIILKLIKYLIALTMNNLCVGQLIMFSTGNILCFRQGIYMSWLGGLIRETYLNFLFFKFFFYSLINLYFLNYLYIDLTELLLVFCSGGIFNFFFKCFLLNIDLT